MGLHSGAFAALQLLLISSVLPCCTANNVNLSNLCSEMKIYDDQLQNQLKVLTSTSIHMSMLSLLAANLKNTNQQQYVKDVVDIGLVFKNDYYSIATATKLLEAASFYGNRKVEIVRKAIEYGGSYWWQTRFFDEKLGNFDRVKALSWITDHHRYKVLLWNFKGWHEKKADRHCRHSTVKAFFEFESKRLIPITDPQDFELLLTALCADDALNWKEFFQHDELRNADPKVLLTFLEHGKDLMRAIDTTTFSLWSLSPICNEIANCKDEQCLKYTSELIAKAVPLPGMTPACLAAIKRTGIKVKIEKNKLLEYVNRFLAEADFPKECDQSFAEIVVRSYQMQNEGAGAGDGKAVGGTVRMVLDLAKANEWASEDTNRLLAAVATAGLGADEPAKFLRVTGLKTADEYLEVLGLFLISQKQDLADKQKSIQLDIKGMLELMKAGHREKLVVQMFFKSLQKCGVGTLRLLTEVLNAQSYPVYLSVDGYAALFTEVCTKEAVAYDVMYRKKGDTLDRIRDEIIRS